MSISEAKRFIDEVAKDKGLADRVKAHASGLAALTAGAKTHGYDFTVDELKQAMRDKAKQNLNDAQLDAIAGGSSPPPVVTVGQVVEQAVAVAVQAPSVTAVIAGNVVVI